MNLIPRIKSFSSPSRAQRSIRWIGFVVLSSLLACSAAEVSQPAISNGRNPASESPAARSMVQVLVGSKQTCSGVLLAPDLVLTAAHCLPYGDEESIDVSFSSSSPVSIKVSEYRAFSADHRRFFPQFDVAWLRLATPAPAPYEATPVLLDPGLLKPKQNLLISGFDWNESGCDESSCQKVRQEAQSQLQSYFNRPHLQSLLTLRGDPAQGGGQTCGGDSGGPSYVSQAETGKWWLVGITNGKHPMITPEAYVDGKVDCRSGWTIQTLVGDYLPWIESSSGRKISASPANPEHQPLVQQSPREAPNAGSDWRQWFAFSDFRSTAWVSVQKLLEHVYIDAKRRGLSRDWLQCLNSAEACIDLVESLPEIGNAVLGLPGQQVPIENLKPFASLRGLRKLTLRDYRYIGLESLARLPALEELAIEATYLTRPPQLGLGLERLSSQTLSSLRLAGLGQEELADIVWAGFPQLRSLELENRVAGWPVSQLRFLESIELDSLSIVGLYCDEARWNPNPHQTLKRLRLQPYGRLRKLPACVDTKDLSTLEFFDLY